MMQPAPIDFYFDFASPYAYFMAEKLPALARRFGRQINWRPVLLFALLRAHGLPEPLAHPLKREYALRDFRRSAQFLGVPYQLPPVFPVPTQLAARTFYLLQNHLADAAAPFAQAVFRAYLRDGEDISQLDVMSRIAEVATDRRWLAAEVHERLEGDECRTLLAGAIDEAITRGVFGSPFVVIDDEAFFGVDRLPQIESLFTRNG